MQNISLLSLQKSLEQNRYTHSGEEQYQFERLLGQSGTHRTEFLRWVFKEYKGFIDTRKQAGISYLQENYKDAQYIIEELIYSNDPDDRDTVNEVLQNFKEPRSYELIKILLKDPYPYLQIEACEFLKGEYPDEVKETLNGLLKNESKQIRKTAEEMLKQFE